MQNLKDEDLNYIQKHLKIDAPEKIADHLKISVKDFYFARLGLTGEKVPNLLILNRRQINKFYSHILVIFIIYLLFSNLIIHDGKGLEQIRIVLPIALTLLSSFFLKFVLYKFTSIEQSPFDLLFIAIQCILFILSQLLKAEVIIFALAITFLLSFIIYYFTVNAILEKDLHLFLKFIPFATFILAVIPNYFNEQILISWRIIHFLCLISIPILICFFIYSQKSYFVFMYGFLIGAIIGTHYLNFNHQNIKLAIILLLYLWLIIYLKFTLKNKIILSNLFYIGLLFIPIGFFITIHLFSPTLFLDYKTFPISSLNFQLILISFDPNIYNAIIFPITFIIYWKFLKCSVDIIEDADCFSEKIFASIAFPIVIAIFLTISKISLWEEVCFYLIFIAILSGTIAKQYYFKVKENDKSTIKVKKITEIKGVPAFILSFFLFLGSLWFYFFAK